METYASEYLPAGATERKVCGFSESWFVEGRKYPGIRCTNDAYEQAVKYCAVNGLHLTTRALSLIQEAECKGCRVDVWLLEDVLVTDRNLMDSEMGRNLGTLLPKKTLTLSSQSKDSLLRLASRLQLPQ